MSILDEFRAIDAAPGARLTPTEEQRRDGLLAAIVQLDPGAAASLSTASPSPARPSAAARSTGTAPGTAPRTSPSRRRRIGTGITLGVTAALAAGALAVGGVVVVPAVVHRLLPGTVAPAGPGSTAGGSLSAVSLASWTSTPTHPATDSAVVASAAAQCSSSMQEPSGNDAAASVSNVDQRGSVTTIVLRRGGYRFFCLVGADGSGHGELVDGPGSALPGVADARSLSVQSADDSGSGATAISTLWGEAGSDVASVTVTAGGRTMTATVQDGLWTAWWPPVGESVDPLDGTVTWTTTDGGSHRSSLDALVPGN